MGFLVSGECTENGSGFTVHRTGSPNVVPVSSAFSRDEFASS